MGFQKGYFVEQKSYVGQISATIMYVSAQWNYEEGFLSSDASICIINIIQIPLKLGSDGECNGHFNAIYELLM